MKTIIIGKESLLTKHLFLNDNTCQIFQSRSHKDIDLLVNSLKKYNKVNIIFNNFYPSAYINKIESTDYENFYNQSILFNAKLFSKINPKKINKIIYSSSSSVYNR